MNMRIVAGELKSMTLVSDVSESTRPTSDALRETIFNLLQSRIDIKGRVVDLYAGTGALGIEAYSRGGSYVVFIETDKKACDVIGQNIDLVEKRSSGSKENLTVLRTPVLTFVQKPENFAGYDLVLCDPPYEDDIETEVAQIVSSGGYIVYETTAQKLDECKLAFAKHSRIEEVVVTRSMGNSAVVIARAI